MKKVIVFIVLKITEIAVIVFMPYGIGKMWQYFGHGVDKNAWVMGLGVLFLLVWAIIVLFLIGLLVWTNWQWADSITKRIFRRRK